MDGFSGWEIIGNILNLGRFGFLIIFIYITVIFIIQIRRKKFSFISFIIIFIYFIVLFSSDIEMALLNKTFIYLFEPVVEFKNSLFFIPIVISFIYEIISYIRQKKFKNIINIGINGNKIIKKIAILFFIIDLLFLIVFGCGNEVYIWYITKGESLMAMKKADNYIKSKNYQNAFDILLDYYYDDRAIKKLKDLSTSTTILYEKGKYEDVIEIEKVMNENINDKYIPVGFPVAIYYDEYFNKSYIELYKQAYKNNNIEKMEELREEIDKLELNESLKEVIEKIDIEVNTDDKKNFEFAKNDISEQIKNAKLLTEYNGEAMFDDIDYVNIGHRKENEEFISLEWFVLDRKDGKALLLSKSIIGNTCYANYSDDYLKKTDELTWENADIRKSLNYRFYYDNFDSYERNLIIEADVENNSNKKYGTSSGNNTKDKIFLLSVDEFNKFFYNSKWNYKNKPEPNKKAVTRKIDTNNEYDFYNLYIEDSDIWNKGCSKWWLRTNGETWWNACYVDTNGTINLRGQSVKERDTGIRPAMWVKYDK